MMMAMKFLPSTGSGSWDIIILFWSIRGKRGRGGLIYCRHGHFHVEVYFDVEYKSVKGDSKSTKTITYILEVTSSLTGPRNIRWHHALA